MAITQIAAPLSGIRGTVAGLVYSANRSGTYVKGWSMCTNPSTIDQVWQRGQLAQAGAAWRTLSTAEQLDWETFAMTPPETDYNSLGDVYVLSGFGWFTRIFLRRRRTGQVDDLIAPVSTPTDMPQTFTLELHPATGAAEDAVLGYTEDDFLAHYAILQLSIAPGVGTNTQTSRYLNCWEALGVGATETEFGVNYFNSWGITQVGMRLFGRLYRQADTGIRSTPLQVFADVVA
jgi:hypothetical protein